MSYAGRHRILTYLSWVLSSASALLALVPFWYIWRIIHDILEVSPNFSKAVNVTGYGWSAVLFAVILRIIVAVAPEFIYLNQMGSIVMQMILNIVLINIVLMVFNLIPVPPLDGFNIVTEIFNLRKYSWWYRVYENGFFILLVLILFDITDIVLTPGVLAVYNLIMDILFAV